VLRDVAIATNFWMQLAVSGFVIYNFGCMIASDTLFDSSGGFSGSNYLMKTAEIECLRVVAMATNFGTKIAINWLCVNDSDWAIGYRGEFEWSVDRRQILQIPCT